MRGSGSCPAGRSCGECWCWCCGGCCHDRARAAKSLLALISAGEYDVSYEYLGRLGGTSSDSAGGPVVRGETEGDRLDGRGSSNGIRPCRGGEISRSVIRGVDGDVLWPPPRGLKRSHCQLPESFVREQRLLETGVEREWGDSRILELANPPELLTLDTPRVVRITLDLLLPTRHARDRQPLAWLARLGDAPVRVDGLPINHCLAVAPVVVKIAQSLARQLSRPHKPRQEVSSRPNFGAQPVLGRDRLGHHGC